MSTKDIDIIKETQESQEDDDLEEGELKDDDDDDDDDDDEELSKPKPIESSKTSQSSERQPSSSSSSSSTSSSSSSSSSEHEEETQSRGSSKLGSNLALPSKRGNDLNIMARNSSGDKYDKYRPARNRDCEDPKDKAAKLISMRTKLLEAKSREIEMKFQKNKSSISPSTPVLLSTITTSATSNLKMTLSKPSISYAENPKPILTGLPPTVVFKKKKSKKSKKKKKKKKTKSSSKKHKKHKGSSTPKTKPSDVESVSQPGENLPLPHNNLQQGPRTPPDNVVVTLDDERIEWPSHLIKMTVALPSISYSVNPDSVMSNTYDDNPPASRKQRSLSSLSISFNSDYSWYYEHYINSFEMDHNQAQHQAYIAMLSSGTYDQDALDKWLDSRGFTRESSRVERIQEGGAIPLRPIQPGFTILKSQKEVVMPNGQVLPPGTVQKIVHPYARTKDTKPEILGPYYDLLS